LSVVGLAEIAPSDSQNRSKADQQRADEATGCGVQ